MTSNNETNAKGNEMKATCPKCNGNGHINAFANYANGICFCCKGAGHIVVNTAARKSELSADARKKAEWILNSTESSYAKLSYATLLKIRNFAMGNFGLQQAYPTMRDHFMAVGEAAFQAAQDRKLEALRS